MSRILVIDDDSSVRQIVKTALELDKHEVVEAENGNEGLRRWREDRPDLVITDIMMPEKDGYETLFELLTMEPNVKVIAMTGGGWRDTLDRLWDAQLHGASRTIPKPFSLTEMRRIVAEVLAQ
ncbi:MAG: response regulator [Gemmatimonadota bacterium]